MKMNTQDKFCVTNWLYRVGLRPTRQRVALANLLVSDNKNHQHVTAEELFEKAKELRIPVSLATVYNTLHTFSNAGLLNKVIVDGVRCYFDTRLDNHSHFYWEDSGKLTDAPGDFLEIQNLPNPPINSEITNVNIIIRLKEKS
tara:strand:- start:579 stop:1007 length:429 start_codon:yes stop_codon:yes gene_type:complete